MFHVKQLEYKVREKSELMKFLQEAMPDSSKSKIKELLSHSVCVDGRRVSQYNYPLQPGMAVTIEKAGYRERLKPRELDIVYEDEHLLVVNKHEGLLSYSKKPTDTTVMAVFLFICAIFIPLAVWQWSWDFAPDVPPMNFVKGEKDVPAFRSAKSARAATAWDRVHPKRSATA